MTTSPAPTVSAPVPVSMLRVPTDRFFCAPYKMAMMAKGCVERQAMVRVGDHRLDYSKCAGCGLGMQVEKAVGEVAPMSRLVNADNCPTCRLGPPARHCGKRYPGWSCHEPLGHEGDCLPLVRFTPEDFAALAEYFDE